MNDIRDITVDETSMVSTVTYFAIYYSGDINRHLTVKESYALYEKHKMACYLAWLVVFDYCTMTQLGLDMIERCYLELINTGHPVISYDELISEALEE